MLALLMTVNLPGSSSYLPEQVNLHRFYTPRTYIKHYDRLLASSGKLGTNPTLMSDEDIERLLDTLRISIDRRDTLVGDSFRRGLTLGEQRRLELGLLVLASPDTVSLSLKMKVRYLEIHAHTLHQFIPYSSFVRILSRG
jgi:ABC-type multidrug transport system ATPase subunit